ncbi:MAG TPA: DNA mismatch repair protein MutS [Bacteroidales bacterium]|nr:DNA mismatch repair protein MutS [Bacteroidales bacterium]
MILNRKNKKRDKLLADFGSIKSDSFDFELIENYFQKKDQSNTFQVLSYKTCNDLDFEELFMFIDRTNSKIGQQFLYNQLRTIPLNDEKTIDHEKLIDEFSNNQNFRVSVQEQLSKLSDRDSYYISSLFQDEHLKAPKWLFAARLLAFTSVFSLIMLFFNPKMVFIIFGVFLINIIIHYTNKKNLYQYVSSLPQLLRLNSVAKNLFKNEKLRGINPNLPISIKIIDKVRNRMTFFRMESKLQPDTGVMLWIFFEFIKILFLLEPLFLFNVLKQLDTKRKEIADLFKYVGQIDSLISVASLRNGLENFCLPEVTTEQKIIVAEEIYHPLIPDCIKNNIRVNNKSILLTGSNMSGKTSFIRTIGINLITGLSLNTCFAKQFSAPRMKLYSAIRISDDLMNDRSYYFEEVLTIKEMIDKSENGVPNLFLLDEIFKGTNTVERISAGKAVLSALRKSDNIVFVSTHDIELADLLKDEYELYHFSEKVDHKTVDFDYKLKDGKLKNRNAIRILQINDYPENIIEEAIEISKDLDKYRVAKVL